MLSIRRMKAVLVSAAPASRPIHDLMNWKSPRKPFTFVYFPSFRETGRQVTTPGFGAGLALRGVAPERVP